MAVTRWHFEDLATLDSYDFEINPNEGGSPQYKKTISYQSTLNGNALIFEGADEVLQTSFSGVILTQEHYQVFVDWWDKRHLIQITDDLGRSYIIYITSFEPKRERSALHPWKHSYTCSYTIVSAA